MSSRATPEVDELVRLLADINETTMPFRNMARPVNMNFATELEKNSKSSLLLYQDIQFLNALTS